MNHIRIRIMHLNIFLRLEYFVHISGLFVIFWSWQCRPSVHMSASVREKCVSAFFSRHHTQQQISVAFCIIWIFSHSLTFEVSFYSELNVNVHIFNSRFYNITGTWCQSIFLLNLNEIFVSFKVFNCFLEPYLKIIALCKPYANSNIA